MGCLTNDDAFPRPEDAIAGVLNAAHDLEAWCVSGSLLRGVGLDA